MNDWYVQAPPANTLVLMKYRLSDPWKLVMTCRRRCCVYMPQWGDSMMLPNFWTDMTAGMTTPTDTGG